MLQDCAFCSGGAVLTAGLISGRLQTLRINAEHDQSSELLSLEAHTDSCRAVCYASDTVLLSGSADRSILETDAATGTITNPCI